MSDLSEIVSKDEIYIIFGGPSLKGFDFEKLDQKFTLGCNKVCEIYPTDVLLTVDPTYLKSNIKFIKQYPNLKAIAYDKTLPPHPIYGHIDEYVDAHYSYHRVKQAGLSQDDSYLCAKHTGHAAIDFAVKHGFKKIHALGLDLNQTGHWHSGYSGGVQSTYWMANWAQEIDNLKSELDRRNITLINYNESSAVKAYEYGSLENI